jgi:transcriptional regulator with XRE-family HTH domain
MTEANSLPSNRSSLGSADKPMVDPKRATGDTGPSINRRRLRAELRQLRDDAGMPQALVAAKLDWSVSKLTRVENGAVGVSVTDVRALLGLYQAGEHTVDQMVSLARRARERRWWDKFKHSLSPAYQEFIGFEADATTLRQFHPMIVPGLLQIEPYIADITRALAITPLPAAEVDSLIEIRLKRQQQVLGGAEPTPLRVVVDEAALRRPVGGIPTMRAQLKHLVELAGDPAISLSVLPFTAGPHLGMLGAFHVMEFASAADETVLYLENSNGSVLMQDDRALIERYTEHWDGMESMAHTGAGAIDFIQAISRDLS